jgi:hypothetical protein
MLTTIPMAILNDIVVGFSNDTSPGLVLLHGCRRPHGRHDAELLEHPQGVIVGPGFNGLAVLDATDGHPGQRHPFPRGLYGRRGLRRRRAHHDRSGGLHRY